MTLEFLDEQQIDVERIFGGPRFILGEIRDTLSIEIDVNKYDLAYLQNLFSDSSKTNKLYTYEDQTKYQIGEGYNILVSARTESRKVDKIPGIIAKVEYYDIHVINIAQLNYDEYQDYLNGKWTSPSIIN